MSFAKKIEKTGRSCIEGRIVAPVASFDLLGVAFEKLDH
jgi:hypothetical protein